MNNAIAFDSTWGGSAPATGSSWHAYKPPNAFSKESDTLSKLYQDEAKSVSLTYTLAPRVQKILNRFADFYSEEFMAKGWDGYEAKPLNRDSFNNLFQLICYMPSFIPIPELVPEPTGELAAVWESTKGELILSMDEDKRIAFSQLDTRTMGQVLGSFKAEDYNFPEQISAVLKVMLNEKAR